MAAEEQGHIVTTNQDEAQAKAERIQKKVLKEIIDSEVTYQKHLNLVVKYFESPLKEAGILPDHVVVTIFSNIRQIIAINEELLQYLQSEGVGQAFLRISPFLKLYSTYANNHERALSSLIEWDQKSPEFAVWRRAQEEIPEVGMLKLNALLITPVQRIPRYRLLLQELLQNTSQTSKDYDNIAEAIKKVSEVAEHINEHIKQQDNFMKMLAIQRSLAGHSAPRILVPGRIFIKEGILKKVSKKGGRSRERKFFLFSDMLMYAKSKWIENTSLGGYNCCCIMPLHHCRVSRVFGHGQGAGALFSVVCKDESLLLYSDHKTVDAWMEALQTAINAFQTCRQTLKKPSSAKTPMRGPALIKYRKHERETDKLENLRNTPGSGKGPGVGRAALRERNWPCLSPHTDSMKANTNPGLDAIIRGPDKLFTEDPPDKDSTCLEDLLCVMPRAIWKRNRRKRKGSEEPTSPTKEMKQSHPGRFEADAATHQNVSSPVIDTTGFLSPEQLRFPKKYGADRRPLSTITETSEMSRMSRWQAGESPTVQDRPAAAAADDEDSDDEEGPVSTDNAELDTVDSKTREEEEEKVKQDIWLWHLQQQKDANPYISSDEDMDDANRSADLSNVSKLWVHERFGKDIFQTPPRPENPTSTHTIHGPKSPSLLTSTPKKIREALLTASGAVTDAVLSPTTQYVAHSVCTLQ